MIGETQSENTGSIFLAAFLPCFDGGVSGDSIGRMGFVDGVHFVLTFCIFGIGGFIVGCFFGVIVGYN
jgi:hypothetical protein